MRDSRSETGSARQQRGRLPPLAPRDSAPTSTRERASTSSKGRPPRLSHRSRAGCWTCRGRKVKCDEKRPRCGPCTRLNRDCDWDHRWNFSDATSNTLGRFSNVDTTGNAVWDPVARSRQSANPPSNSEYDLPDFAVLTSDEDRERKAGTHRPGTYGVVVTPESFRGLPEYASVVGSPTVISSRRTSTHSSRGGYGSPRHSFARGSRTPDPNTVILDKFVDVSLLPTGSLPSMTGSRRSSNSESLQQLSLTVSPYPTSTTSAPAALIVHSEEELVQHFRQYIVPRLVQPQTDSMSGTIPQGSFIDFLEREASRFPPLHHAICAISALNLTYDGKCTLEDALEHYSHALAASATASMPNDLTSDAVFFRHFLLFVYDICVPSDDGGTDMWAEHLLHLQRIASQRHRSQRCESYAYILWKICNLDMYACFMGSGTCEFVQTVMQHDMLPLLNQQVPSLSSTQDSGPDGPFLPQEVQIFPTILRLNEGIVIRAANLAHTASIFRSETESTAPISPGRYARWQATTIRLQTDLHSLWQQATPPYLLSESLQAISTLPERPRCVFENALLLYHATTLFSRTSMFPRQRRIPIISQNEILQDSERRIQCILSLAAQQISAGHVERRETVFPLFMAGCVTVKEEAKIRAVELMQGFEGKGIGGNCWRTRRLLVEVCEEQRRVVAAGESGNDVEWLEISRRTGLGVVNCGL